MYSRTRLWIACQLARMQIGISAGGQDHERQRDAVDAHGVGDGAAEPGALLDELEVGRGGIEAPDQNERDREGDQRGPQRDPARVARAGLVLAQQGDEQRAGERQEGDDGEDRPARHQCASREHEPGDEGGDADQHGEGVVIEIAGLQPHDAAGHVEHAGGDAVGPEPVDDQAVAALPQEPAEPQRGRTKRKS